MSLQRGNVISATCSTTTPLASGASFTGTWFATSDYTTVSSAVFGSMETNGTLYFDLSTDGGVTYASIPNIISNTTNAVPRILNIVESHLRVRYVNGDISQTGTFSIQTKYSNSQSMSLLTPIDGSIKGEDPAMVVRAATSFDLDAARIKIEGQRSFFFFGFDDSVGTSFTDIHPNTGDINWQTSASKIAISSSDAADTSSGLGVRSVELHGLSATGEDQTEIIATSGTTESESTLDYLRLNKMHSETCGTHGGSHQGDITARIASSGAKTGEVMSLMVGEEGAVDTSVQYGAGEAGNGYWSVPLGKVMYITRLQVLHDIATNKTVDIYLYERESILTSSAPFPPRRVLWQERAVTQSLTKEFKSHIKIKSLADIWFRAKATSTSAVEVSLDFYLVDADSDGR